MSFDTYIINLEKDKESFESLSKILKEKSIDAIRFNAIYGKEIQNEYDDYISKEKDFLPKSCIGIGLSHYLVSKQHFENDNNKIAMILEDDADILFKDKKEIDKVIKDAPEDWDIILLYTQGITNYKDNTWETSPISGSSIGYLINKKGFEKFLKNFKVSGHYDNQRIKFASKHKEFKVYKTPKPLVFPNENNLSYTSSKDAWYRQFLNPLLDNYFYNELETDITHYTGSMASKYKLFRIPETNIELDFIEITILFVSINILLLVLFGKNKIESLFFTTFYFLSLFFSALVMLKFIIKWNKMDIIESFL